MKSRLSKVTPLSLIIKPAPLAQKPGTFPSDTTLAAQGHDMATFSRSFLHHRHISTSEFRHTICAGKASVRVHKDRSVIVCVACARRVQLGIHDAALSLSNIKFYTNFPSEYDSLIDMLPSRRHRSLRIHRFSIPLRHAAHIVPANAYASL